MKKLLSLLLMLSLLALCIPASAAAASRQKACVDGGSADRVHLRMKPAADARSLGLYFTGTEVECWSDPSETWVHVSIGAEDGYMMSKYLSLEEVSPRQPVGVAHTDSWLNLRKLPTKDSQRLATLREGDTVTVLGETAYSWYYINAGGVYGYVYERYLELNDSSGESSALPPSGDELPLLRAVLENRLAMRLNGGEMLLSQFMEQSDMPLELPRLAVLDLDGDGQMEAVVKEYTRGTEYTELGSLVLDVQQGTVYAYDLSIRALNELKADGTFTYSSGAADNGVASLKPEEDSAPYQILAESRMDSAGGISYTVNGLTVTAPVCYTNTANGTAADALATAVANAKPLSMSAYAPYAGATSTYTLGVAGLANGRVAVFANSTEIPATLGAASTTTTTVTWTGTLAVGNYIVVTDAVNAGATGNYYEVFVVVA